MMNKSLVALSPSAAEVLAALVGHALMVSPDLRQRQHVLFAPKEIVSVACVLKELRVATLAVPADPRLPGAGGHYTFRVFDRIDLEDAAIAYELNEGFAFFAIYEGAASPFVPFETRRAAQQHQ